MATPDDIETVTRCCGAPHRVGVAYDANSQWHEIVCTRCGLRPARTYNRLRDPASTAAGRAGGGTDA